MIVDRLEDGTDRYTAHSWRDLLGWHIVLVERFKPGVLRLHCTRRLYRPQSTPEESRMIYCDENITPWYEESKKIRTRAIKEVADWLLKQEFYTACPGMWSEKVDVREISSRIVEELVEGD